MKDKFCAVMRVCTMIVIALISFIGSPWELKAAEQATGSTVKFDAIGSNKPKSQNWVQSETAGVVNVYTSRKEALIKEIFEEFTRNFGIKVNYILDDASKLIARMEYEKQNTQADVFLTSDVINLTLADKKGLLSALDSQILNNAVPAELRSANWVALTKRTTIIVYAKDRVDAKSLSSFENLADPAWFGKLVMRSSNSPYTQSLVAWMIDRLGEYKTRQVVRGIVKNMARKPRGGDIDQIRAVAFGEGDVTVVNNYYVARILASDLKEDQEIAKRVAVFFPEQSSEGTMVNISGAGIAKFSKNRENAIKLLEFMIKPSVQRIYAERNHEYPVVPGIRYSEILSHWAPYKMDSSSLKQMARHGDLAIKISDEEAWK